MWKSKFYDELRWRGDASTEPGRPRHRREHPTHWLISTQVVARGATLALRNGVLALIWLRFIAGPFLAVFIGGKASGALEVQKRAATYVRVRALGAPFLLLGNALTAALLGAKDSAAPLIALAASAGTNILGDFIAVGLLGRGVRGAAEATALSQVVQAVVLARLAAKKLGTSR